MRFISKLITLLALFLSFSSHACEEALKDDILDLNAELPKEITSDKYVAEEVIVNAGVLKCKPQINKVDIFEDQSIQGEQLIKIVSSRVDELFCDSDDVNYEHYIKSFGGFYVRVYNIRGEVVFTKLMNINSCSSL